MSQRSATWLHHSLFVSLFVAVVGLVLVAVPTALGGKPIRTVIPASEPFVIPAGFGCPFGVGAVPDGRQAITQFSDGRTVAIGNADITFTNLETGTSYVQNSNYHATNTYDPEANALDDVVNGRIFFSFFPGDQGPFGEVGENGALYAFVGTVSSTFDLDTFLYTSFSHKGTVTDVCAALSA